MHAKAFNKQNNLDVIHIPPSTDDAKFPDNMLHSVSNSLIDKGPQIPIIVQISIQSISSSANYVDRMRFGAYNLMNTGLMRSVNTLILAIMIYHQSGGAEFTGSSARLHR